MKNFDPEWGGQSSDAAILMTLVSFLENFHKAPQVSLHISNLISCTHFGKVCSRLGNSRFVFCKNLLEKKSRNHDLPKCVQEIRFEICQILIARYASILILVGQKYSLNFNPGIAKGGGVWMKILYKIATCIQGVVTKRS